MSLLAIFKDLLQTKSQTQKKHLTKLIRSSNWRVLRSGDVSVPGQSPDRIVIGFAIWDSLGLHSIELLLKTNGDRNDIWVFDLADCPSMDGIQNFLPEVKNVIQTPVVVEYRTGALARKYEGKKAREWMEGLKR